MLSLEPLFLWRSYRRLRQIDLVVVAGSGQLLDAWRGPWLHPYTVFRWSALARLAHVPMIFPSVGAGPIRSRLSAFFIRTSVALAERVSVRDGHSKRVLASLGSNSPLPICPDMGYGLPGEILFSASARRTKQGQGPVIGLNVMAHQDPRYWPHGEPARYDAYLRKMVAFTRWLLDSGCTVRLFSSQPRADGRVAADLVELLAESADLDTERLELLIDDIEGVGDLIRAISGCDFVVAARYHSVLIPLLLDIPALGLAYNPKTTELLTDVGHPERCLDIDSFTVDSLIESFQGLRGPEPQKTRMRCRARVSVNRRKVEQQFDDILGNTGDPQTSGG